VKVGNAIFRHFPGTFYARRRNLADEVEPGVLDEVVEVQGVHLTLLASDDSGKADIDRPKIMLGSSSGWSFMLAPPNDLLGLCISEGIFGLGLSLRATGRTVSYPGSRLEAYDCQMTV
jgi:hypothetical protein